MIQKKKFSDAIAANISVVGELVADAIMPGYDLNTVWANKLKYATIKNLGLVASDGNKNVLLVCKYNPEIMEDYHGVMGRFFGVRGGSIAMNISLLFDVVCTYAFNGGIFYCSNSDLKCGRCTYNGAHYIAVQLGSNPKHDVLFSGIYSKDCVFLQVLESNILWID